MGFRFSPCGPCCDTCSGVNTTISGRVTIQCPQPLTNPNAGYTVTATGPATVSTTTNNLGDYTLIITKKGTYTVTATGPCGTQSQDVVKNTCSVATTGINFSFAAKTLTVNLTWPCYSPTSGSRPYVSFYSATWPAPGHPAFPISSNVLTFCAQPGSWFFKVWDSECFEEQIIPVTMGCSDQNLPVTVVKKKFSISGRQGGCLGWGNGDGQTVTISGAAGSGTTVTDAGGNWIIGNLTGDCEYHISISGPRYQTYEADSYLNCGDLTGRNGYLEVLPGYYCFGICCNKPFTNLRVSDSMGEWPVDMGTMTTQCITKPIHGYPIAADFGSPIGILCRPYNPPTEDGYGPITAAYKYVVRCNPASGFNPGKWEVIRYVPGCYQRPVPFPDGPGGGNFPVDSSCGLDGWPKANSGTTILYTAGEAKFADANTCGSFNIGFSMAAFAAELGDATLIAD